MYKVWCDIAQRGGESMEEVKVKVIEQFYDREHDLILRTKDDILTVTEERAQKLIGLGHVELIELNDPPKMVYRSTEFFI